MRWIVGLWHRLTDPMFHKPKPTSWKGLPFSQTLYNFRCEVCGGKLEWEAYFDADGTDYHAKCSCCYRYRMSPATVDVEKYREETE